MPQRHGASARTASRLAPGLAPGLAAVALALLLGGCSAIYDDTKGWASRLEASLLEATKASDEAPAAAAAAGETARTPDDIQAGDERDGEAAPAVATPLMRPARPATGLPQPSVQDAEPQGLMAEATADLLAPAAATAKPKSASAQAPAKQGEARATPPLPKPKPAPPALAAADSDVAMVLHLASLRSEQAAKREWSDLQSSFPDRLGKMPVEIQRTEVGDKGTFYRVLAGPLPSRSEAKEVCSSLKQKSAKQYCQVMPAKPKA